MSRKWKGDGGREERRRERREPFVFWRQTTTTQVSLLTKKYQKETKWMDVI